MSLDNNAEARASLEEASATPADRIEADVEGDQGMVPHESPAQVAQDAEAFGEGVEVVGGFRLYEPTHDSGYESSPSTSESSESNTYDSDSASSTGLSEILIIICTLVYQR